MSDDGRRSLTILRRLLLWTVVCSVSAAPSYFLARGKYDRDAMIFGVCLFIAFYTLFTSTAAFERFHNRAFMRRTMYIGYGTRLAVSVAYPIGFGADMVPGIISIGFVENVLGLKGESFEGTLAITIVQGTILNLLLTVFMAIVYSIQRALLKPPPAAGAKGFDVVLPSADPPVPVLTTGVPVKPPALPAVVASKHM